jgi:hypothetical protein
MTINNVRHRTKKPHGHKLVARRLVSSQKKFTNGSAAAWISNPQPHGQTHAYNYPSTHEAEYEPDFDIESTIRKQSSKKSSGTLDTRSKNR